MVLHEDKAAICEAMVLCTRESALRDASWECQNMMMVTANGRVTEFREALASGDYPMFEVAPFFSF